MKFKVGDTVQVKSKRKYWFDEYWKITLCANFKGITGKVTEVYYPSSKAITPWLKVLFDCKDFDICFDTSEVRHVKNETV